MKFCNICVFVTGLICLVLYYVNIKKKSVKLNIFPNRDLGKDMNRPYH